MQIYIFVAYIHETNYSTFKYLEILNWDDSQLYCLLNIGTTFLCNALKHYSFIIKRLFANVCSRG